MTDITELAQSLKAAAEKATQGNWRAFQYHDGRCGIGGGHHDEIMVCEHISKERPHDAMFIALANPANVLALVEALEKAQQVDEELCKLLPPGVEYMDPPDGGDVTPLEGVRRMVADYRQRIAELEESHAQVIQSRDHYKRISGEGLKQLAESSTVTVKLTDINEYLAEVHDKTLNRAFRLLAEGVRAGDVAAMRAAGIKVEAE